MLRIITHLNFQNLIMVVEKVFAVSILKIFKVEHDRFASRSQKFLNL